MEDEHNDQPAEARPAESQPPVENIEPKFIDAAEPKPIEWEQVQKGLDAQSQPFDPNVGMAPRQPPPKEEE